MLNTIIIEKKEEEAADVDMGGLFGDDEYWAENMLHVFKVSICCGYQDILSYNSQT